MKPRFALAAAVLAAACIPATAQMVVQADMAKLQPNISRDEQGFSGCGVRAIVIETRGEIIDAHDFALSLDARLPVGILKAGKTRHAKADFLAGRTSKHQTLPAPQKFWIAVATEGKALTPIKIQPAETPGFVLETADIVDTINVISSMVNGERMQFSTHYKSDSYDRIVAFSAKMPREELEPLVVCLDNLIKRITAD